MQLGEFEKSSELVKQVENKIEFYHKSLGPANRIAIYFNLAVLNFGLENYSRSLNWINAIINNPADTHTEDVGVSNNLRILRLILYYELGYLDILEYELRSTYRYIFKRKNLFRFDQLVLQFIRKTVYERGWVTKPTGAHPSGGPVAGGAIGTSGMPLTVQQRTQPGPPTRYWRKTRSTWNGAETTAAANSVGVSSSRTRIQRSSRSGVRTGWWVISRFRSGCRVIRVAPCNGGVVGHPSPGGRRLAFRRKVFGTQA